MLSLYGSVGRACVTDVFCLTVTIQDGLHIFFCFVLC
jgi:hypothetical protein